jgi:hypothetical protein
VIHTPSIFYLFLLLPLFNSFIAFFELPFYILRSLRNVLFLDILRFFFFFIRCVFALLLANLQSSSSSSLSFVRFTLLKGLCVLEILVLPWRNFAFLCFFFFYLRSLTSFLFFNLFLPSPHTQNCEGIFDFTMGRMQIL